MGRVTFLTILRKLLKKDEENNSRQERRGRNEGSLNKSRYEPKGEAGNLNKSRQERRDAGNLNKTFTLLMLFEKL
jgi:hypothetical protein